MRAALMGMISIFARQVGRRQVGLVTLMAVAALMCLLFSPLYIWDVGFQLSFFATLGLILYAEPFSNFMGNLFRRMLPADTANAITNPFNDFVVLTFAAQLTTIPIMVYHFQQLSLVSFIANPFILPVQPMVMLAGGFSLLASHIWIVLGKIAGFIAWPFALYTIRAVEFFNWKSWVLYFTNVSVVFPVLYYVILFAMTFFSDQVKNLFKGIKSAVLPATAVVLFACVIFTWKYAYTGSDDKLHITFMNVGSADAILVQSPTGRRVLINGGPKASLLSESLGRSLPPFSRQLDWLVIASTNENQLTALPRLLDRYPPENVLWSGNPQASFSARQVQEWLIEDQTPITFAEQGQRLDLGQGAFIEVAAIGPRGSVLSIQWNNFQALLPIGVDLQSLQMEPDALDVLLLADSGYAPSNPEEWIKRANPQLIVLDVAAGDENGMPSQDTLKAVGGYTLLRTDMNGWISITTDGETMQVEVQKK
jgi:competence protein ComEC